MIPETYPTQPRRLWLSGLGTGYQIASLHLTLDGSGSLLRLELDGETTKPTIFLTLEGKF